MLVKSKKDKPVNMKLFTNGSIQMTGCVVIDNAFDALENLFCELKKTKAVFDFKDNIIKEYPFVSDISKLTFQNIPKVKVAMINSNFNIGFKIDRKKLYKKLKKTKRQCSYDPVVHAPVNIKIPYGTKKRRVSIFVFAGGSIIITGARSCNLIAQAYDFINRYLLENYNDVRQINLVSKDNMNMYLKNKKEQPDQKN